MYHEWVCNTGQLTNALVRFGLIWARIICNPLQRHQHTRRMLECECLELNASDSLEDDQSGVRLDRARNKVLCDKVTMQETSTPRKIIICSWTDGVNRFSSCSFLPRAIRRGLYELRKGVCINLGFVHRESLRRSLLLLPIFKQKAFYWIVAVYYKVSLTNH